MAKFIAYSAAVFIVLAYMVVGYAIYVHIQKSWPMDESLQLIPVMGSLSLLPGIALAIYAGFNRPQLSEREFRGLTYLGLLGALLLPMTLIILL